ncbi:MAG TPA: recombinase family protein [Ruminococcaceae bacterium]|nr:recombinase family protein [Oscillospiraceae bacterium]
MNHNTTDTITIIPARHKSILHDSSAPMKRVAAYCRVSTEQENQQNSYAIQIHYYTDFINSHINWQLVGIFADEGISGTRTKNRTQFNHMIRMARQHKIDLILCKSISRFARNTVDCLKYVRELKALGVTVIFEKEHINTDEITSEFAISLYASFAQAESESISRNVTWGIEKSFREGNVRYQFHQTLGYRLENGRPVIIEPEAALVREIFRRFADGESASVIAQTLTERAVPRKNGRTVWSRNNIYQILKNEKYVGDAILQKTYTVNCLTHERAKNNGQKPKILVQNCHEAIIDRSTYDLVRLELERRRRNNHHPESGKGIYQTKYCLSRLLICPCCGSRYKRAIWIIKGQKTGVWRCRSRLEGNGCSLSPSYHENKLHQAVLSTIGIFKQTLTESDNHFPDDFSAAIQAIETENRSLLERLSEIEAEREGILSGMDGYVLEEMSRTLRELNLQEHTVADRLESLRQKKEELHRQSLCAENVRQLLMHMTDPPDTFDEALVCKLILKVEAVSKKEVSIVFHGGYQISVPVV